jgi:ubiquinone/menaquinone biosynthesis C-methylase UbiE
MEYWTKYWNSAERFKNENPHAKVGRTVFGKPIAEQEWNKTVAFLEKKTSVSKTKNVLDLCCGNGLLSVPFAAKAKSVTSIDYSKGLIAELKSRKVKNINAFAADVNKLDFKNKKFDIIIMYFAIQHFTQTEAIALLRKAKTLLSAGGCIYIGDIPDEERLWNFFYTKKFKKAYFDALGKSEPIIGNWFTKEFFKYLGEYLNYNKVEVISQPSYMINHHYRFDVMMKN